MKIEIGVILIAILLFPIMSASEVMIVSDPNSFTGVVLRIIHSDGKIDVDPIYPSEFYVSGGVVKFKLDSTLTNANLSIKIIKSGEVIKDLNNGPFDLTKNVTIEMREGVLKMQAEVAVENVSAEVSNEISPEENITENATLEEEVVDFLNDSITGYASTEVEKDYPLYYQPLYYAVGGVVVGVVLGFLIFRWLTRGQFRDDRIGLGKFKKTESFKVR